MTIRLITLDLLLLLPSFFFLVAKCESFVIQPKLWEYRSADIGYEIAHLVVEGRNESVASSRLAVDNNIGTLQDSDTEDPILLLNGFGVGSFHQHRLIPELLRSTHDDSNNIPSRTVYCMDYLGQGRSWPKDCQDGQSKNELGLQYSAETWVDQIITFLEEVVLVPKEDGTRKRVHLVGNSVGGHLAAYVAVRRPDLISSICLLNPTPVWGLNLPGWSGHLPAPIIPKAIGRVLFDQIRDLKTIERFLEQTYSRRGAITEELMHQIRGCTTGNGGHAAFASILWSPPLKVPDDPKGNDGTTKKTGFQECLSRIQCDVLLVFGKDDPWCKPALAKKMLFALDQRGPSKVHRYVEITNAGHCPNHEAPQAVGHVVKSWVTAFDRSSESLSFMGSSTSTSSQSLRSVVFQEEWGETALRECGADDIKLGLIDRLASLIV